MVEGFKLDSKVMPDPICEPCLAGKMHANPFPNSHTRAKAPLELVHSDVHDVGITSPGGYRYWITFIDDCTHFRAVMLMKRKSETFTVFRQFKAWAEKVTGRKIKILRHDKGGEYMSNEFITFCKEHGIAVQKTARNRPQQNGVSERANRTIAEMLTAALNESGLPKTFWAECLAAPSEKTPFSQANTGSLRTPRKLSKS
jgi:transposase InsO family protein